MEQAHLLFIQWLSELLLKVSTSLCNIAAYAYALGSAFVFAKAAQQHISSPSSPLPEEPHVNSSTIDFYGKPTKGVDIPPAEALCDFSQDSKFIVNSVQSVQSAQASQAVVQASSVPESSHYFYCSARKRSPKSAVRRYVDEQAQQEGLDDYLLQQLKGDPLFDGYITLAFNTIIANLASVNTTSKSLKERIKARLELNCLEAVYPHTYAFKELQDELNQLFFDSSGNLISSKPSRRASRAIARFIQQVIIPESYANIFEKMQLYAGNEVLEELYDSDSLISTSAKKVGKFFQGLAAPFTDTRVSPDKIRGNDHNKDLLRLIGACQRKDFKCAKNIVKRYRTPIMKEIFRKYHKAHEAHYNKFGIYRNYELDPYWAHLSRTTQRLISQNPKSCALYNKSLKKRNLLKRKLKEKILGYPYRDTRYDSFWYALTDYVSLPSQATQAQVLSLFDEVTGLIKDMPQELSNRITKGLINYGTTLDVLHKHESEIFPPDCIISPNMSLPETPCLVPLVQTDVAHDKQTCIISEIHAPDQKCSIPLVQPPTETFCGLPALHVPETSCQGGSALIGRSFELSSGTQSQEQTEPTAPKEDRADDKGQEDAKPKDVRKRQQPHTSAQQKYPVKANNQQQKKKAHCWTPEDAANFDISQLDPSVCDAELIASLIKICKDIPGALGTDGPLTRLLKLGLQGSSKDDLIRARAALYELKRAFDLIQAFGNCIECFGKKITGFPELEAKGRKFIEFDIELTDQLIEIKNKLWKEFEISESYTDNAGEISQALPEPIQRTLENLSLGKIIAEKHLKKAFEIHSNHVIPPKLRTWLIEKDIAFVDGTCGGCGRC